MNEHRSHSDDELRAILASARSIALVGATNLPSCPSWAVMTNFIGKGYDVTPVNAGLAGQRIFNRRVFATLAELPQPVDIVGIFRDSEATAAIVDDALTLPTPPKAIWMHPGACNQAAAVKAERNGVRVVMGVCPKAAMERLGLAPLQQ